MPNPNTPPQETRQQRGESHTVRNALIIGGIGFAALAGCAAGISGVVNNVGETHSSADLEKAHTESRATVLQFDPEQKLQVAKTYFKEQFTATGIPYSMKIDSPGIDILPDANFTVNKQLNGAALGVYEVPFTALSKPVLNPETGKTNVVVDRSKVTETLSWAEMPYIQDFTIDDDGNKNFEHADGFRRNLAQQVSDGFKVFNVDKFSNTMDALDAITEHTIAQESLDSINEACTPQLKGKLEQAIRKALKANVASISNQNPDNLNVTFTPGDFTWTVEKLPEPVEKATKDAYKYDDDAVVAQDFHVDKNIQCDVPESSVKSA